MDDRPALFWRLSAWDSVLSGVSLQVYMCKKILFKQMGKYSHNACYEYLRNCKYPSNFCQHVVSNYLACALHHSPVQSPLYFHQDPWIKVAWMLKTKVWISCGSSGSETGYYWLSPHSLCFWHWLLPSETFIRGASRSLRENCSDPNSRGTDR